ncbi:NmrA family NAD(P)-binding protein [Lysobacter sp. Root690]|uniref:NmrA family NAD(P)-binding protein n=1 Tax=Lysobacter sp. Root690 TaxID=1736588 RepID=UPI0006F2EC46|nr:NmrA family NAD(P)-binding protein [Lysobacter sp. Root690]KRB03392.1 NmrA family transcriptional regulator [Lysobacter sp. Root690]
MHIILGGTGHVGSALAETLLERGEAVTVVSRNTSAREAWERRGARFAVVDVQDVDALRRLLQRGRRLFLLNPPAAPATDTDAVEKANLRAILAAIEGSDLEKIVAESTYGAQDRDRSGDLGILYDMEQALRAQPTPFSVIRAAYYMSNWDASLHSAREHGKVLSFYPADFSLPMVAPRDLGRVAADLITEPVANTGMHHVEGPRAYSPADVADAFAQALGREVEVEVVPRAQWVAAYQKLGFSEAAAKSYADMTAVTLDKSYRPAHDPVRGQVSLQAYVQGLVDRF